MTTLLELWAVPFFTAHHTLIDKMYEAYIPDRTVTQIVNQMMSDHYTSDHPPLGNSIQIITFTSSMHDNVILANFMVSILY